MRPLHRMLCAAALLALAAGHAAVRAGDDAKKDKEKLQGSWQVTKFVAGGMELPKEVFSKMKMRVEGDTMFTTDPDGKEEKGSYKLDTSKKPRQIDLKAEDGPDKGKTVLGIYEIDGDTFKLCASMPGEAKRPTEFAAPEKAPIALIILQRVKK